VALNWKFINSREDKKMNIKKSVIALAIGVFAVSCGGSGSKQPQQSATTETKTEQEQPAKPAAITVDNWRQVVKEKKYVDIPLPDGWSAKETKINSAGRIQITLNMGGSTSGEQYGQMLFEATKSASTKGNHDCEEGEPINDYNSALLAPGSDINAAGWCFTAGNGKIQVDYSSSSSGAQFEIY
jgi:hypothetical protein